MIDVANQIVRILQTHGQTEEAAVELRRVQVLALVILTEERRARTQAADRAALDSSCETEAAFPLENSLLETKAMTKIMALARKAASFSG